MTRWGLFCAYEPYCIYIGYDCDPIPDPFPDYVPGKKIYMALRTDAGMRAGYERVVLLDSDASFDAEARGQTKNLYLIVEEDGKHVTLLRHNGTEWVDTSSRKDLVLDILASYDKQKVWNDPETIKKVTSLYHCYLFEGELKDLDLSKLDAPGLKEQVIDQMLAAGHIPEQMLAVRHIPAGHDSPGQKKRPRDTESTIGNGRNIRKCLKFDFRNTSNEEDSASTFGLSPAQYSGTFFSTPRRNLEKNQEEANNSLAALKARVEAGNGSRNDYIEYANHLLNGKEPDKELAKVFLLLADELPEVNTGSQQQKATEELDIFGGPNPFVLDDDLVALDDDPGFENDSKLSPSF